MRSLLLALALAASPRDTAFRAALSLVYDGYTDTALLRLAELAEAAPDDPMGPYLEALALCWKIEQRPQGAALDKEFGKRVDRAIALAAARLREDPEDAGALLARGAAFGVRSRLHLFRGRNADAAASAVRMRADLLRVRKLDPESKDALFGLGLYDYYADVLPRMVKLLRFLARLPGGNRERGLALIEQAREAYFHGAEVQVQLFEIYAFYEDQPDRAYEEIRKLRDRYPNAPLWALKLAEHQRDRLGLYAESATVAREILEASEKGHPNYAGALATALAQLSLGESLLADLRFAEARRVLLTIREGVPGEPSIGPRARLLLGRSLELEGDREGAEVHYRLAGAAPERGLKRAAQAALASPIPPAEVRATQWLAEGRRLSEAGHHREAAEAYGQALKAWPRSQEAALRVAEHDVGRGRLETARRSLSELLSRDDPYPPWVRPWTWLLLGRLHDLAGDRAAAVREYKKVWKAPCGREDLREQASAGLRQPYALEWEWRGAP